MNGKNEMITQSTILTMGWTKTMIKNLLPEPTEKPNPHYKCAAPMKLWERETVLEVMKTENFNNALEKANKRKNSAKRAVKTKEKRLMEKMVELANSFDIKVIPDDELIEMVLKDNENRIKENLYKHMDYCERKLISWNRHYYNEFESYEDICDAYEFACCEYKNFEFHTPNEETLKRWIVNYIRHNLIKYDLTLYENKGKVGKDEAYPVLKKAVLDRIAITYPQYADECKRQAETIGVSYYA